VTAGLTGRFGGAALTKAQREQEASPSVRLGDRLFRDDRFSTPDGDLPASCSHCHLYDEDPQGMRAYADFFNRSWVSFRMQDQRRLELRNSPSILDALRDRKVPTVMTVHDYHLVSPTYSIWAEGCGPQVKTSVIGATLQRFHKRSYAASFAQAYAFSRQRHSGVWRRGSRAAG